MGVVVDCCVVFFGVCGFLLWFTTAWVLQLLFVSFGLLVRLVSFVCFYNCVARFFVLCFILVCLVVVCFA